MLPIALAVGVFMCMGIGSLAIFSNPEESMAVESKDGVVQTPSSVPEQQVTLAQETSVEVIAPAAWLAKPEKTVRQEPVQAPPPAETRNAVVPEKKVSTVKVEEQEPAEAPAPVEPVATDGEPAIVRLEEPVFPAAGPARGGEVIVMVQIDQNGKPIKTMVAKSTNPDLNSAIVTAVLRSTYRPGMTQDGPTTKWMTIPFRIQ